MKGLASILATTFALSASAVFISAAIADDEIENEIELEIIHMGDVHGHLIPRP